MKLNKILKALAIMAIIATTAMATTQQTVNISGKTVAAIRAEIQGHLDNGRDVLVTGALSGVTTTLELNVPANRTITWTANYEGITVEWAGLIQLYGLGTFELTEGRIVNSGPSRITLGNMHIGSINVSGGTVSGDLAIVNWSDGEINITGGNINGIIQNSIWSIFDGSLHNGTINISGGSISGSNRVFAIENNSIGTVNISGNATITGNSSVIGNNTNPDLFNLGMGVGMVNISGGNIIATGDGVAIDNGFGGELNISGGLIKASTGFAVSSRSNSNNGNLNMSGGVIFAYGSSLQNVVSLNNFTAPTNDGLIIWWDASKGKTEYTAGMSSDLFSLPANKVEWNAVKSVSGISYANGKNVGFIEVAGVVVIGEIIYDCDLCNDVGCEVCDPCGHDIHDESGAAATCTTPKICNRNGCEHILVNALGHIHQNYVLDFAATCMAAGEETAICERANCEVPHTRNIAINPNAHDWIDNWIITKEPTCISKGNRKRECNIVGCSVEEHDNNTDVLPINANAHDWGNWANKTPATCTEKATEERICRHSSEHKETQDVGEALEHSWSEKITIPATCEAEGSETRNCNRYGCGVSDVKTLPKLQGAECATSIVDTEKSNDKYGIRFAVNPVSENAEISVVLPNNERATETKIVVYDITGNIVFSTTARDNVSWDLRNSAGRFVANGTYLVIAEVKDRSGGMYQYSSRLGVKR